MKEILHKFWNEPAAAIGLLVTLGLLAINLIGHPSWGADTITAILAPLISSLGIRQLVSPVSKEAE